tara:strand:- start:3402 stop:4370 length:969 start_codon:yes stop_codon:yes gene_type:complete
MHAFTVATDHEGFLHSLRSSAKLFGYDLHVLGLGERWGGFTWRWELLRNALRKLPPHEPVVLLDGYDTLFTAPAALLEDEWRKHRLREKSVVFAGVEHRPEHCSFLFWKLTQVFGWWYYGTAPPLVNAGVLLGRADILSHLCSAILEQAERTGERDDQRILNSLVAHDARRGVDTLVLDRGGTASVVLHKLPGFHSHCDRTIFGPLRHLFSNVPHVPAGPLNYDDANGDFTEWLQTHNQPLKVGNACGQLDLVYVCHGIFSTHLGPICDALGIERPPPVDLAKRKISQADLRVFVETSRKLFRALGVLLAGATVARAVAWAC